MRTLAALGLICVALVAAEHPCRADTTTAGPETALHSGSARAEVSADSLPAGDLLVTVTGLRPEGGVLIVGLYDGEEGWLDLDEATRMEVVPAETDTVLVVFGGLPHSDAYAVQVIHDENENGKLDMRWFPYPKLKEGAGVSNNNVRRGPPEYDRARFGLSGESAAITVIMRY